MKIDRRLIINFDWVLIGTVLLIAFTGLLNLYSISRNMPCFSGVPAYMKQFYWVVAGLVLMFIVASVDYRFIVRHAYTIYALSLLLLLLVFFCGKLVHGSQRWLTLWSFSFQPSELMKLTVVIALTKYFSNDEMDGRYNLRSLVPPFLIVLIPLLMISRQPDLGTALFLVIIFFSFVMFVGIRKNSFIILATTGMVLVPLGWFFLKDYQKERVLTFLNPERDPLGAGYHTIQSIIAVGSGGGFGKGIFRGTQSQLRFLPEQKTDFAFSVFAEEWGFLGTFLLILMFFVLVLWGIKIAKNSKDLPGMLLAYGVTMYILWGVLINIGMVIGILPVVGIPLPFISYGGSSMIILMMGVGLLMNVSMRKFMLQS